MNFSHVFLATVALPQGETQLLTLATAFSERLTRKFFLPRDNDKMACLWSNVGGKQNNPVIEASIPSPGASSHCHTAQEPQIIGAGFTPSSIGKSGQKFHLEFFSINCSKSISNFMPLMSNLIKLKLISNKISVVSAQYPSRSKIKPTKEQIPLYPPP